MPLWIGTTNYEKESRHQKADIEKEEQKIIRKILSPRFTHELYRLRNEQEMKQARHA